MRQCQQKYSVQTAVQHALLNIVIYSHQPLCVRIKLKVYFLVAMADVFDLSTSVITTTIATRLVIVYLEIT